MNVVVNIYEYVDIFFYRLLDDLLPDGTYYLYLNLIAPSFDKPYHEYCLEEYMLISFFYRLLDDVLPDGTYYCM